MHGFLQRLNDKINHVLMPVLTVSVIVSLTLVTLGSLNNRQIAQNFHVSISEQFELQELIGQIIYLDEVLTMSSRMAAATGESQWEIRYRRFEPKLDSAIKEAINLAPETFENHTVQINKANTKLVAMENRAFSLVENGYREKALAYLFSDQYQKLKEIYRENIEIIHYTINDNNQRYLNQYSTTLDNTSKLSLISLVILAVAWLIIVVFLIHYLTWRKRAESRLQKNNEIVQQRNMQLKGSQVKLQQKAEELENTLNELRQAQLHMVQSEKMSSLGHLVAGVAHEINNPMSFIYGNLNYISSYTNDLLHMISLYQQEYPQPTNIIRKTSANLEIQFIQEDLPNTLKSVEVGAERIRDIILSLRNFSRMDESSCKAVDIHEGIDNTLLILNHRLKAQSNQEAIRVEKLYGDIPLIECYAGSLNQVFMNILSNAIDALEEKRRGSGSQETCEVFIRTRLCFNEDFLEVAIADNGIGMSQSVQKKLFEPFFTTKPLGKGTGMGMPISYQIIVEKHGGQMKVKSAPGKGTEFCIQIPVNQSDREMTEHSDSNINQ